MGKTSLEKKKDILFPSILCFCVCALIFSVCPFSPFYRYCFEPDEICYMVMSRGFLAGKIPYRDLFDHKGPLTYFIYGLGLLISGKSTWGIWVIFTLVDVSAFFILYKTIRFFYDPDRSFISLQIMLCILFAHKESVFSSGTKPEHVIFLLLVISEYLFVKRLKEKKDPEKLFSCTDLLIQGLLCGAVFTLKLNFCIFYLCFVGMFFIYQLYKKRFLLFLKSAGAFLTGIFLVVLPLFGFYYAKGALDDLIDVYFRFNSRYAKAGGYNLLYFRRWISFEVKIAFTIMCLFAVFAFVMKLQKTKKGDASRKQLWIYFALSIAIYAFMTLPLFYAYALTAFIPICIWGTCLIADFLIERASVKKVHVIVSVVFIFIIGNFLLQQLVFTPPVPKEKTNMETKIEAYMKIRPDATYMYFADPCGLFFYDMSSGIPDFKYFYAPNGDKQFVIQEQAKSIQDGVPDSIAFFRIDSMDDEYMDSLNSSFSKYGYTLYVADTSGYGFHVYIRTEDYQKLTES
ncbi:MAG: glycosyltransferase family 39 protein [Clostridiales bacterium]|nr:glycosyltransferase family 39 protein [Clostridiales bacterium]